MDIKERLGKEAVYLLYALIALFVVLKVVFYKETFWVITRIAVSFFWMFVLPGFAVMFIWQDKLSFGERLVAGIALSAASIGTLSYHFGLAGIHAKYHWLLLPLLIIIIAAIIIIIKKNRKRK
jgi:hypothetical protein